MLVPCFLLYTRSGNCSIQKKRSITFRTISSHCLHSLGIILCIQEKLLLLLKVFHSMRAIVRISEKDIEIFDYRYILIQKV